MKQDTFDSVGFSPWRYMAIQLLKGGKKMFIVAYLLQFLMHWTYDAHMNETDGK